MWSNDKNFQSRGFSTPQPTWKSRRQADYPARPHSEGKRISPVIERGDLFHVIHKVPPGDSPYVRAKHIQLIEKDPSRAISLFWAAINAGDRVDSALKDMAVVMKQLDRSDEAIEAIKSFRHLCPCDSQESIDNLLVELYKRSGRIEEEIEMLQCKLKNIEEGLAFGGKRTKIARSQGKKIQITMEQERSRILGNLAWACLQQNKYEIAEQHYRKALSLEPDKNKQCNLAICLMKMNRMTEARSLLQAVRASCGNRQMDESYAKSFERAFQMLTALESQTPYMTPMNRNLKEVTSSINGGQDHVLYTQPRPWRNSVQLKDNAAVQLFSQPIVNGDWKKTSSRSNGYAQVKDEPVMKSDSQRNVYGNWERESWTNGGPMKESLRQLNKVFDNTFSESTKNAVEECFREMTSCKSDSLHPPGTGNSKKSWADMAEEEEEEEELLSFDVWNSEEEFNDENMNSNINPWPQNQVENVCQKLGSFDLKDGCGNAVSSRNLSVRRSLCFDQSQKPVKERYPVSGNLKRRNRLQVFRDITPVPDSP